MTDDNGISKDAHREGEKVAPSRSLSYKIGSGCTVAFFWFITFIAFLGAPLAWLAGFWAHILKVAFESGWGLI